VNEGGDHASIGIARYPTAVHGRNGEAGNRLIALPVALQLMAVGVVSAATEAVTEPLGVIILNRASHDSSTPVHCDGQRHHRQRQRCSSSPRVFSPPAQPRCTPAPQPQAPTRYSHAPPWHRAPTPAPVSVLPGRPGRRCRQPARGPPIVLPPPPAARPLPAMPSKTRRPPGAADRYSDHSGEEEWPRHPGVSGP